MNAYFVVQGCLKLVFRLREAVCCLHLLTRSIERVNLTWDIYTFMLSLTQVSIQTFPANQDIHISISVLFLQCSFYFLLYSFTFISCSIHQSLFLQCSLALAFILLKHFTKCKYFHANHFWYTATTTCWYSWVPWVTSSPPTVHHMTTTPFPDDSAVPPSVDIFTRRGRSGAVGGISEVELEGGLIRRMTLTPSRFCRFSNLPPFVMGGQGLEAEPV